MKQRTEIRDGVVFTVTELPEAKPPKNRSAKTRFHFVDVEKPGTDRPLKPTRQKKRRRKRGSK